MYLIVGRVTELPAALDAREAAHVVVNKHVVVETVLTRERRVADQTQVGLDARVTAVVVEKGGRCREHFVLADFAHEQLAVAL